MLNDSRNSARGWGTYLLLGVFGVMALTMAGLVLLALMIPRVMDSAVERYTDAQADVFGDVTVDDQKTEEIEDRIEEFREAVEAGEASSAMNIPETDLNALVRKWLRDEGRPESLAIKLHQGRIETDVSIPLDRSINVGPWSRDLTGRHLNGTATIGVEFSEGQPRLHLESLAIKGRELPGWMLDTVRPELERLEALDDPDAREFFDKLADIRIDEGLVVLTPRVEDAY